MAQTQSADGISAALAIPSTLGSELMVEIERYLAAVAVFRALDHEPSWRSEGER